MLLVVMVALFRRSENQKSLLALGRKRLGECRYVALAYIRRRR